MTDHEENLSEGQIADLDSTQVSADDAAAVRGGAELMDGVSQVLSTVSKSVDQVVRTLGDALTAAARN